MLAQRSIDNQYLHPAGHFFNFKNNNTKLCQQLRVPTLLAS